MKKVLSFSLGLIFIGNFLFSQTNYISVASTNWNLTTTWNADYGAGFVPATDYPGQNSAAGAVVISLGDAVTITASVPNPIGSLSLIIGNGAETLTINNGVTLNVSGNALIAGQIGGGPAQNKTIIMNGASAVLNITGNLTLTPGNATTKNAVLEFNGGTVNVTGNVAMSVDNALQQRTQINFPGNGTLNVGGTLTGGTINSGAGTGTIVGDLTSGTTINVNTSTTTTITGNLTGGTINPVGIGTLNITGNAASDTVTAGSAIINIGGNISAPIVTGFNGTVNFNGSGTQTTAGPLTLVNLGMTNAASTLQLGGALTVTGTLTLTAGKIDVGPNTLTLSNATPATQLAGAPGGASYVYTTNATGRLVRQNLVAGTPYTFPVGTPTNYMPVITNTTAGASSFAVSVYSPASTNSAVGGPQFSDKSGIVDAMWYVDRPVGAGTSSLTLNWVAGLEGATFAGLPNAQLGISRHNGTSWSFPPIQTGGDNTLNFVTASFTTFSPFVVAGTTVALPVKFGSIKAYEKQNGIQLDWKVYSENKVRSYEIERSADGRSYTSVGSLPALYNNTSDGDYGFFDANPLPGTSYYRIKNNDLDGKSAYSIVVRVNRNKTIKGLSLYPNPVVNGIVLLQGSDLGRGNYKINIFGANGQEIYKQQLIHNGGTISHTIELPPTISKGVYMLSVKDDNGNVIFKEKLVNQ